MKIKVLKENEKIKGHKIFDELPDSMKKAIEDSYEGTNLVYDYDKEDLKKFFEEVGIKTRL